MPRLVLTFVLLLVAHSAMGVEENMIWSGLVGGKTLEWTASGLFYETERRENLIDPWEGTLPEGEAGCWMEGTISVLSVVDPYVSFERRLWKSCPGKPILAESKTWGVMDVRAPKRVVKLTDFFSAESILKALLSDPTIRGALAKSKNKKPSSLSALMNSINRVAILYESQDYECFVSFERILSQFAFAELERDRVLVKLFGGLEGHHVCEEKPIELDLWLTTPQSQKASLKSAESRKQGYLQRDFERVTHGKTSKFKRELSCEMDATGHCSSTEVFEKQ